ncbi:SusC/RagA family TonB-linked outer membrane protein [Carboxylicivirga sediminis]|uniref:SusC/RagA family TonB-linked outer membrane protein n=1 Tax=Carboxylicivirga sediminis TaxID=2006564 RepID=A0A941ITQ8_9BACT|nr:SusC/RagA family TonB-linked outer membrane protein [Carboxylicivirga sediminis]MBR8533955.1 SusC/RagA family TonB-linked outer membrane protein [Carboxylicivirga sediminis]
MEKKCSSDAICIAFGLLKKLKLIQFLGLFMLVGTIQVQATAYSKEHKASIHLKNKALVNALDQIRQQTGYSFVYSSDIVDEHAKVTIDADNMPLDDILELLLANQNLEFKILDDIIVINKSQQEIKQPISITKLKGKVMIAGTNEPLPGANVIVKEGNRGTVTDVDGNFIIDFPSNKTHLVVTFIGFIAKEIKVGKETELTIYLDENVSEISQVVVTGMQKREKSKMIGSVSSIDAEKMEFIGATTVDEAMKGQMAGVYVQSNSGNPGEVGNIVIRGTNTMTGNRQPLFVLDGMPMADSDVVGNVNEMLTHGLGNIPPEDIESITVLRDATAASVYGSRAANGVVVITTKQGKSGKDYISYSGKYGVTMQPQNSWNFMNSNQKVDFELGIYDKYLPATGGRAIQIMNQVNQGYLTAEEGQQQIDLLRNTQTDWMDVLYRNAFTQSHNVTMSGGTDKLQYHISANYNGSQGALMENDFQQGTINMKVNRFVNENLLLKFNMYSTLKERKEGISAMNEFEYAVYANPYEKPFNADGSYAADQTYLPPVTSNPHLGYYDFNIVRELRENTRTNTAGMMRAQIGAEYTFLDDFRIVSTTAVDYNTVHSMDEIGAGTYTSWAANWLNSAAIGGNVLPEYNLGRLQESFGRTLNFTMRNSLEYNKRIDKHYIQGFGAIEIGGSSNYQFNSMLPVYLTAYRLGGYPAWSDINGGNFDQLALARLGGSSFRERRNASYIASGVYSYDNRYVANFNIRYDGVDIIGNENQFQPLWSAGAKWNAHEEGFMKNNGIFDRLVFSMGYGYRGSINRDQLPFHTYSLSAYFYDGMPTGNLFTYGNPNLRWEQKRDINLGLELSVLQGRANFEVNYFDEKVTDLLDMMRLPNSSGREFAYVNVGELSNQGFELSARFEVIKQKDFMWEVGGNFATINNSLDQVYNVDLPANSTYYTQNVQGYAVNSWYGYKFSHIDENTGAAMVWAQRKNTDYNTGKITYTDELIDLNNTSSQVLNDDYAAYHLGQRDAKFYGGFNTRVFYKGFDVTANFVYAGGNQLLGFQDVQNGPNRNQGSLYASRTNLSTDHLYAWTQPGDITDVPGMSTTRSNYDLYMVDSDLESGNYLRLQSLSIGWRAPKSVTENSPFNNLSLRFIGSNLFTLTNFSGSDPETRNTFGYPITPNYTLSVTLGF